MKRQMFFSGLVAIGMSSSAFGAMLDFESSGQLTANFAQIEPGNGTMVQFSDSGANFVRKTGASMGSAATIAVYDQTPTVRSTVNVFPSGFSVTLDARFSLAGQSFGVYAVNPADDTKGILALFNVDDTATTSNGSDRIRFFSGSNPKSGNTGSAAGDFLGTSPFSAGATGFNSITFTYGVDPVNSTQAVMSITAGSFTQTSTFAAGTAIANPQLALRVYGGTTNTATVDLDNVNVPASTVLSVPEPTSASLLLAAGGLLLARRRRAK